MKSKYDVNVETARIMVMNSKKKSKAEKRYDKLIKDIDKKIIKFAKNHEIICNCYVKEGYFRDPQTGADTTEYFMEKLEDYYKFKGFEVELKCKRNYYSYWDPHIGNKVQDHEDTYNIIISWEDIYEI